VIRSSNPGRPARPGDPVLVTGASTGLGLEAALHLAAEGLQVFAGVHRATSADTVLEAAAARGVHLQVVPLDLLDGDSIDAAVATVVGTAGSIFGLVNNGGIGLRGAVEDSSEDEIRAVYETNVLGTVALTQAVLPHMRAAGCGRIVTITSIGGRVPGFGVSIYCSSKFAQEGFAEGLALEVAPFGIQSIIVEPGMIKTTRWADHRGTARRTEDPSSPYFGLFWASEAIADRIVERSPTRPEHVADAVLEALTAQHPRLRYVVGRGASVVIAARRHLPPRLFERLYYGGQLRRLEQRAARPVPPAPAQVAP
jgi:NAD(P)-dependent dehydrogenase (short-subunit alcohol dehydrogenase family)